MDILFGVIIIISLLIFLVRRKRVEKINYDYDSEFGKFKARGSSKEFIIKKDSRFEFLVKEGVIIACRDKNRHKGFIYYGGKKDV